MNIHEVLKNQIILDGYNFSQYLSDINFHILKNRF